MNLEVYLKAVNFDKDFNIFDKFIFKSNFKKTKIVLARLCLILFI